MRKPRKKAPPKPRNLAAKALASGLFRKRVEANPKAYKRRPKHKSEPIAPLPGNDPDEKS
jgi:stalled ribosome alternative rescue factor ArfA